MSVSSLDRTPSYGLQQPGRASGAAAKSTGPAIPAVPPVAAPPTVPAAPAQPSSQANALTAVTTLVVADAQPAYTAADGSFWAGFETFNGTPTGHFVFGFYSSDRVHEYQFAIAPPAGQTLGVGTYGNANSTGGTSPYLKLERTWGYEALSCMYSGGDVGRFTIEDLTTANDGSVTSFAVTVRHKCATDTEYTGYEFRYSSAVPINVASYNADTVNINVPQGRGGTFRLTAREIGTGTLHVASAQVTAPFTITADTCSSSAVAPDGSCYVDITWSATTGDAQGTLSITDDTAVKTRTWNVYGSHYVSPPNPDLTNPVGPQEITAFDGVVDAGGCGSAPCVDPGEPWVAVSPDYAVEMTHRSVLIADRLGHPLLAVGLASFFGEGPGEPIDGQARIAWDSLHGRWIATEATTQGAGGSGFLYVAVSHSADPRSYWTVYSLPTSGFMPQQPAIGISSDKVVIAFARLDLAGPADGGTWAGSDGVVFDSATLYAHPSTITFVETGVPDAFDVWVAATGVTAGSDIQLIMSTPQSSGPAHVVYRRITGTIAANTLSITGPVDLTTGSAALAPFQGGAPSIQAAPGPNPWGAGPFTAVWQNGRLWAAHTSMCTPTVESSLRWCVRVIGITTGSTPSRLLDVVIAVPGSDVFGGGIGLAQDGAVFVTWSQAVAGEHAAISSYATYRLPTDPAGSLRAPVEIATGTAPYTGQLWDVTRSVATDPNDPRSVWIGSAYSDTDGLWSTRVSQLSEAGPVRYAGTDRFSTAAAISAHTFPSAEALGSGVDVAYIAYAYNFPDALAAAAAAGTAKGPVLLADSNTPVNSATINELIRIRPKKIVILGGTAVLSAAVMSALSAYAPTVERWAGSSRFATAAAISANTFAPGVDVAYIAYAYNFPDALAGAAAAGTLNGPILLADTNGPLDPATALELQRLLPKKIVVLGGTGVISDSVVTLLRDHSPTVERLSGADRFATAAAISAATFPTASGGLGTGVDAVYIAYAYNFPDALAAAAAAGTVKGPILLVTTAGPVDPNTLAEINRLKPTKIIVLGGTAVVGNGALLGLLPYTPH